MKPSLCLTIQRIRLGDLAARLGCELHGDPDIEITGVAGMEQAGPTELTFLANPKYAPKVKDTRAGAILVEAASAQEPAQPASLVSANPYHDFARALALFYQPPRPQPGIHPQASIAATARIGEGASIGAFAVVGEHVTIGRNAVLHPHVVIYEGAEIGDDFCAHSHAVVREYCRDRQSRDSAERRGGGRRRIRFRQDARRHALQDRAVRRHGDRRRRRDPDR